MATERNQKDQERELNCPSKQQGYKVVANFLVVLLRRAKESTEKGSPVSCFLVLSDLS